ncbi:signal recognition particle, SRP19 subunit [Parasitella parasitica]|nr:signal recognition particle, SRP19 subunit [Parasitella parasitica]
MSMLHNLKKTQKNHVFLDDGADMDVDNMDFPLPDEPTSSSSQSRKAPAGSAQGMPDLSSMMGAMGGLGGMGGMGGMGGGMPDMAQLQQMMQSMGAGGLGAQHPGASMAAPPTRQSVVTVASGPNGVAREMRPEEYKDWLCVYPCYIDADKSVQEGRKIAKEKSVKNPHAYHMAIACQKLGFSVVYEGKRHPRDWANVGRVRVQIKNNNFFINQEITSRKELFVAIAKLLPQCQKEGEVPNSIVAPTTTLAEIEALADEQRKAQGLPTMAEMQAQQTAQQPQIPSKPRKQKVKYVRG